MKFFVDQIKMQSIHQPFTFEKELDISDIKQINKEIITISPVIISGSCVIDKEEFIFTFSMEGQVVLPCARTLVEVNVPFEYQATEVYTTKEHLTDEEVEDEIHPIEGQVIDLRPQIIEQMLLQLPYRVFSDQAAIEDGNGWNYYHETEEKEEQRESIDPRLSKLQQLLNKDQEE